MTTQQSLSSPAKREPIRYDIIDNQTRKVVGKAKTRAGARRMVDNRDNAYGAYRYSSVPVWA